MQPLELYGAAIAFTRADKNNYNIIKVAFNTVGVSNPHSGFDIKDDLSFERTVDLYNKGALFRVFREIVGQIGVLTEMQQQECLEHDIGFRPVWVMPGVLASDISLGEKLFTSFFAPDKADGLLHDWDRFGDKVAHAMQDVKGIVPYERIIEIAKLVDNVDGEFGQSALEGLLLRRNVVIEFTEHTKEYFAANPIIANEAKKVFSRLEASLDQCKASLGAFTGLMRQPRDSFMPEAIDDAARKYDAVYDFLKEERRNLNDELKELEPKVRAGDKDALYRVKLIAREAGKQYFYSNIDSVDDYIQSEADFCFAPPWKEYAMSIEDQQEYPVFGAYLSWNLDIGDAFRSGYEEKRASVFHQRLKVPIDGPAPFFTDPCAELVREELHVALGLSLPENSEGLDGSEWRDFAQRLSRKRSEHNVDEGKFDGLVASFER